ncbi:hypothetical protein NN561_003051 [Cricetulus griseus]
MANLERTFIAIKPDGVQRGLVGDIIKRFEQKGFRLVAMKFLRDACALVGDLKLKVRVVDSCPLWVLGAQLGLFGKAMYFPSGSLLHLTTSVPCQGD